jgi:hypothetical protein
MDKSLSLMKNNLNILNLTRHCEKMTDWIDLFVSTPESQSIRWMCLICDFTNSQHSPICNGSEGVLCQGEW